MVLILLNVCILKTIVHNWNKFFPYVLIRIPYEVLVWQSERRGRPTWVLFLCVFRLSLLLKALLQISHLWGRKPVWISLCRVKSSFRANCLSQLSKSHWKGFSPVWVRKWQWRFPLMPKRFSHKVQGKFFGLARDGSLRCVCRWFFKLSFLLKALLQISHLYGRKSVWISLCRLKSASRANRVSQPWKSHWKGFSPVWARDGWDGSDGSWYSIVWNAGGGGAEFW